MEAAYSTATNAEREQFRISMNILQTTALPFTMWKDRDRETIEDKHQQIPQEMDSATILFKISDLIYDHLYVYRKAIEEDHQCNLQSPDPLLERWRTAGCETNDKPTASDYIKSLICVQYTDQADPEDLGEEMSSIYRLLTFYNRRCQNVQRVP